jgi:hypothetical protein
MREQHSAPGDWTCPSCGARASSAFCGACGEERPSGAHLDLRHLAGELLENFAHFDGRLLRSLRTLLAQPGELTRAFVAGKRKPFVGPLQLFLVVNVFFFAMQSLTGMSIFSRRLEALLAGQAADAFQARLVHAKLERTGLALADYAARYDSSEATAAKTWVILMVPLIALCLIVVCGRPRNFVRQTVFALHFLSFQMLAFAGIFVLASIAWRFAQRADPAASWSRFDAAISIAELASIGLYAVLALRRASTGPPWMQVVRAGLLVLAAPWILALYREALFLITYAMT